MTKRAVLLLVFLSLFISPFIFAQKISIFAIDISGSMSKDNLFRRVQDSLITYVNRYCNPDDR